MATRPDGGRTGSHESLTMSKAAKAGKALLSVVCLGSCFVGPSTVGL